MSIKKEIKDLDEDELEALLERIMEEKEEREISDLSDDELLELEKEIEINLEGKRKEGKVNGDPIIEL